MLYTSLIPDPHVDIHQIKSNRFGVFFSCLTASFSWILYTPYCQYAFEPLPKTNTTRETSPRFQSGYHRLVTIRASCVQRRPAVTIGSRDRNARQTKQVGNDVMLSRSRGEVQRRHSLTIGSIHVKKKRKVVIQCTQKRQMASPGSVVPVPRYVFVGQQRWRVGFRFRGLVAFLQGLTSS